MMWLIMDEFGYRRYRITQFTNAVKTEMAKQFLKIIASKFSGNVFCVMALPNSMYLRDIFHSKEMYNCYWKSKSILLLYIMKVHIRFSNLLYILVLVLPLVEILMRVNWKIWLSIYTTFGLHYPWTSQVVLTSFENFTRRYTWFKAVYIVKLTSKDSICTYAKYTTCNM